MIILSQDIAAGMEKRSHYSPPSMGIGARTIGAAHHDNNCKALSPNLGFEHWGYTGFIFGFILGLNKYIRICID